jgi:hypothetical protein
MNKNRVGKKAKGKIILHLSFVICHLSLIASFRDE